MICAAFAWHEPTGFSGHNGHGIGVAKRVRPASIRHASFEQREHKARASGDEGSERREAELAWLFRRCGLRAKGTVCAVHRDCVARLLWQRPSVLLREDPVAARVRQTFEKCWER